MTNSPAPFLGSIAPNTSTLHPRNDAPAVELGERDLSENAVPDGVQGKKQTARIVLHDRARKLLPENRRFQNCQRVRIDASRPVQVFRHPVTGALYFGNVQTCGKRYCPTCGPRISNQRAAETVRMAEAAEHHGYDVLRAEWTYRHTLSDTFTGLLARQREAFRLGSDGSSALSQRLKRAGVAYLGSRRALDYTYGQSGHHPHEHGVLFVESGRVADVTGVLVAHWESAAERAGLDVGSAGVQVQSIAATGAGYLFKPWDRPDKSSQTSRTLFQLLRDADAGDEHAGRVWREVALGMDGVRLVSTSPGLKLLAQVAADDADERLARPPAEPGIEIASIWDWRGPDAEMVASLTAPLPLAAD